MDISIFFDVFKKLMEAILIIVKWPLIIFSVFIFVIYVQVYIRLFIAKKNGAKFPINSGSKPKKPNVFVDLFVNVPKMIVYDYLHREDDYFAEQGCVMFCGKQGRGKTVSIVKFLEDLRCRFPKCKIIDNMDYAKHDAVLDHWLKLIDYKNGKQGVVAVIDETQNWFGSNQAKRFPPQMLSVITQNRKNRRLILGTSQSFHLLAKTLRSQVTEVRDCVTLLNCITFVFCREPFLDYEGNVVKMKFKRMYWFVHTISMREDYDTYKTVEALAKAGFMPEDEIKFN